jgi:ankyrin repeat protein
VAAPKDNDGKTPFGLAVAYRHARAASLLLKVSGAEAREDWKWTPAHKAACRSDAAELCRLKLGEQTLPLRMRWAASSG